MTVLAQVGFGPKDKLSQGLNAGVISGAILSPRYLNCDEEHADQVKQKIDEIRGLGGRVLLDPEYYAVRYLSHPNPNLGNLETWDYFKAPRRSALISGEAIPGVIREVIRAQDALGLQEWISPNVYVESADSIDSAISMNFVGKAKEIAQEVGGAPVLATLAINRNALLTRNDFQDYFDALTSTDSPPDGYYLLVGSDGPAAGNSQVRSDIDHPEVIAGWMYMNYVLSINGARVVNGYCHHLSPLMTICGSEAVANGWFSGLRCFSMEKYVRRAGGGRYPLVRYASNPLLARIKWTDYVNYKAVLPEIANGLACDYSDADEPTRTEETLQSWEAISALVSGVDRSKSVEYNIEKYRAKVQRASQLWTSLQEAGFSDEIEPNLERLESIERALDVFMEWAELV